MTVYHNGQRLLVPYKNQRGDMVRVDGELVYNYPGGGQSHSIDLLEKYVEWWQENLNLWLGKNPGSNPFGLFENKHNRDV